MNLGFLRRDIPKKRAALAVAAMVLVAGVVAGREKPSIEIIQERNPEAARIDDGIDLEKLRRGESSLPQNDPFARRSFGRSAPVQKAVAAKPAVPPLPFQYFGKLIENGKLEVFVMRGDELLSIAPGQKLGADYRVDQISETSISFTYLPLKTKQTLDFP